MLEFPNFDPIVLEIGPFVIRWYALSYIAGLLIGWRYLIRMNSSPDAPMDREQLDGLFVWITIGIILGGRIGYVLFYNFRTYLSDPLQVLKVWQGGMAFHGGLIGVIVMLWWFCHRKKVSILAVGDQLAQVAPIGLGLGRIANFINGELWGRVSDVPWAMVFPYGGPQPRHPSQLYQAFLEGFCLFLLVFMVRKRKSKRPRTGYLAGVFLFGYGVARAVGEAFRQPDGHIGFLWGGITMGQLLSLPLIIIGLGLMWYVHSQAATKKAEM